MPTKTILLVLAAFLLGYYLSAKVAGSFIGKFLTPLSA